MPVKSPSFSDITISPEGSGLSATTSSSRSRPGSARSSSSRSRVGFDAGTVSLTPTTSPAPDFESLNSVFTYDETVYDTELTGSGITSAYPVVIGTVPFTNPYENGELTNTGYIYQIQNDLKDATVETANNIVNNYFTGGGPIYASVTESSAEGIAEFDAEALSGAASDVVDRSPVGEESTSTTSTIPDAPAELAAIRDANNEKYNKLVEYLPKIVSLRDVLINAAKNTPAPSDASLKDISTKIATTTGESFFDNYATPEIAALYVSEEDEDVGDFNIPSVGYATDDITRYDSGTKNLTDRFVERFMGDITDLENNQSNTAIQYQLLKAVLFQASQGIRLDEVEDAGFVSPFRGLDYQEIGSVESFTADRINRTGGSSWSFAKATISKAAEIIDNRYAVPAGDIAAGEIEFKLLNFGIHHSGYYGYDSDGVLYTGANAIIKAGGDNSHPDVPTGSITYLNTFSQFWTQSESDGAVYFGYRPIISVLKGVTTAEFIKQIPLFLAYDIMDDAGNTSVSSLPMSVNPIEDYSTSPSGFGGATLAVNAPDILDTAGDEIRYIQRISGVENQKIAPFDVSFPDELGKEISPISSVLLYGDKSLDDVSTGLSEIIENLKTFAANEKSILSNQCALYVLRVFYAEFSGFFRSSIFGGVSTSSSSAYRAAFFAIAADDDELSASLYRAIDKKELTSDVFTGTNGTNSELNYFLSDFFSGETDSLEAFGGTRIEGLLDKEGKIDDESTLTSDSVISNIFYSEGVISFKMFDSIVSTLVSSFPTIGTDGESRTRLSHKIRFSAFIMFMYFLRLTRVRVYFFADHNNNYSEFTMSLKLRWDQEVMALLVDCFDNAFIKTELDSENCNYYKEIFGAYPEQYKVDACNDRLFKYIRSPVKNVLQASQDAKSLLAHQITILQNQVDTIDEIKSYYDKVSNLYGGDSDTAARIISRYLTPESIVELLYRSTRYQNLIPNTGITAIASRSQNYRSIVETVFKDIIPSRSNLAICIAGIPYGHLERLRLAEVERKNYFGIQTNVDDVRVSDDTENDATYQFKYIKNSSDIRPEVGGPFSILIPEVYDDFSSSLEPTSVEDDSIALWFVSSDLTSISYVARSGLSGSFKTIDYRAYLVQAALQSYLEDFYGLYLRYASTKHPMRTEPYPEEAFADLALQAAGLSSSDESTALEYARLRSMIMMHRDFVTTRMLEELEASPLFDKIVYVLFSEKDLGNILNELYVKVNT